MASICAPPRLGSGHAEPLTLTRSLSRPSCSRLTLGSPLLPAPHPTPLLGRRPPLLDYPSLNILPQRSPLPLAPSQPPRRLPAEPPARTGAPAPLQGRGPPALPPQGL